VIIDAISDVKLVWPLMLDKTWSRPATMHSPTGLKLRFSLYCKCSRKDDATKLRQRSYRVLIFSQLLDVPTSFQVEHDLISDANTGYEGSCGLY